MKKRGGPTRKTLPVGRKSTGRVPLGRPTGDKPPGTPMSFVAYPDDVEALAKIETVVGGAVRTRRSVAIRRAIREYAATLPDHPKAN